MFRSSHFSFLVTFGNEVTKMRKSCVIFVYILQGQMGKTEKTRKKITQLKWQKYQKPNDKIWDERKKMNIAYDFSKHLVKLNPTFFV